MGTDSASHADALVVDITPCNEPFADTDGDGDVDHDDFGVLQLCITGTGGTIPSVPEYCVCFDRPEGEPPAADGDIDQTDIAGFEACASGPDVPADPACED